MRNSKLSSHTFIVLILIATIAVFQSCKQSIQEAPTAIPISESMRTYISSYTSGEIRSNSKIKVRFTLPQNGSQVNRTLTESLFTIQPNIKGRAIWENNQTLVFIPTEKLPTQTSYLGKIDMSQLFPDIQFDQNYFEFNFRTKPLRVNVHIGNSQNIYANDLRAQKISGYVNVSDDLKNSRIEEAFSADQDGRKLNIQWEHNNGRYHYYTIDGIERIGKETTVNFSWDKNILPAKNAESKFVTIPSIHDFFLLNGTIDQSDEQKITLEFSDPLSRSQELDGLISIENYTGKLKTVISMNQIHVFPAQRILGSHRVIVSKGIKNANGSPLKETKDWTFFFEPMKPQVRAVSSGVIIPKSNGIIFPFEAVNLKAVDVEIFKIHDNNILQFLQTNQLDGNNEMHRVGRVVKQKKIDLNSISADNTRTDWSRYGIDLSNIIDPEPDAIYQVRIGFKKSYAVIECEVQEEDNTPEKELNQYDEQGEIISIMGNERYYHYGDYWDNRNDPCTRYYYNPQQFISKNVIASNIGIIAKKGNDNSIFISASDLKTTAPMSNVQLDLYNFSQEKIKTVSTNSNGTVTLKMDKPIFTIIAKKGRERSYLKLIDPEANSLSRFDVSGVERQKGLKGFIYGERGVWRPGDSLFLNFVLEDKQNSIPKDHPITFKLIDPRGQENQKLILTERVGQVFPIHIATSSDAPTGNYMAMVEVGGAKFDKTLKIETVKPNRLKMDLNFENEELTSQDKLNGTLQVNWLHGAPANELRANVEVQLKPRKTEFDKFANFVFDDPARIFKSEPKVIFDSHTDKTGTANVTGNINLGTAAPGVLNANFKMRAFETGGDFSTTTKAIKYHPYESYAGIEIPGSGPGDATVKMGSNLQMEFVAVDKNGTILKNKELDIGIYKLGWSWWYDRSSNNISKYNTTSHLGAVDNKTMKTNSNGIVSMDYVPDQWGRYLIRVCDNESGHCSGDFFRVGYPRYDGDGPPDKSAAAMLSFTTDKPKYGLNEEVTLTIPSSNNGRYLISIETADRVIETFWQNASAGENKFKFITTSEMAPTAYVHVSLLQPHGQVENDLPIRLYGVTPIKVEDRSTVLKPVMKIADNFRPEENVNIKVSEENGKAMTYTVAVVDDGLLGLTNFKTPNPWNDFFAREALGVKTWDIYDDVLGALTADLSGLLSIGGDGEVVPGEADKKANRFKPVVTHFGPFNLNAGATANHNFKMPNYVGSVRTMIVASGNGAYGSAESTTPVKKPLMILATLPRVLGPGESLRLPVNVFAMEKHIKNVNVTLEEINGLAIIKGDKSQSLQFSNIGDDMVYFDIEMKDEIGIANFVIRATSGNESTSQKIEIQVRNPNPEITDVVEKELAPGESYKLDFDPIGMKGSNSGVIELSSVKPMNLGERLNYVIRYPHGCLEQTTSAAFPQLYVNNLIDISGKQKKEIDKNVKAAIKKLRKFQLGDGGFAYWPGALESSEWGSNYAGHFIIEAKESGYPVPEKMLSKWIVSQQNRARNWQYQSDIGINYGYYQQQSNDLMQAYRLYTLALVGSPELGAMNRMRQLENLSIQAKWRLAGAYALAGRKDVSTKMIAGLSTEIPAYKELSYTYGSHVRDYAMILESVVLTGNNALSTSVAQRVADFLGARNWYSTQTTAYSLLGISKYFKNSDEKGLMKVEYALGNNVTKNTTSKNVIKQIEIPIDKLEQSKFSLTNNGDSKLYVKFIQSGQPKIGTNNKAFSNNLELSVAYKTKEGESLNPSSIAQGTDFIAEVTIKNPGTKNQTYAEMALTQIFPAGWEIQNTRMDNMDGVTTGNVPEYQDIRDDRVYTYFDLPNKTKHVYSIQLNAAYQGRYFMPPVAASTMYDNEISANNQGAWVEITVPEEL